MKIKKNKLKLCLEKWKIATKIAKTYSREPKYNLSKKMKIKMYWQILEKY
jgi:hypothetical protein